MDPEQYLIADEDCLLDVLQGQAAARLVAAVSRRRHADRRLQANTGPRSKPAARSPPASRSRSEPLSSKATSMSTHSTSPIEAHSIPDAAHLIANRQPKPALITVEEAKALPVAAGGRPVRGASQSRPASLHEAARLPQGHHRPRRGHALHHQRRPPHPRFLRWLRLAGVRPQPSAHPRRPQEVPGREAPRDRDGVHVAVCLGARAQSGRRSRPAISTWCSSARPDRRPWRRR